jgi:hypothetical protein
MRCGLRELVALAAFAAVSSCTCTENQTQNLRFACNNNEQCAEGFVCRGGECRPDNSPPGACLPTDPPKSCNNGCQQSCGSDGGLQSCAPAAGGPFVTNPQHCGECARACSERLGTALTCLDNRCTCVNTGDCPTGHVCNPGGVCILDSDSCANIRCSSGEVCRNGTCGVEPCTAGCGVGEVCDSTTSNCRPISACRLPGNCGDGGICEGDPKPDGEACDDGVACTHTDVCVAGTCSGTTYACTPGACQLTSSCAGDGGCTATPIADGTACTDGNNCTFNDACAAGACTGTTYTCTAGQCDQSSSCSGDGGCTVVFKTDGSVCDDGNLCTFTDVCAAGGCAGTGYACPPPTTCQAAVACNGDGGCLFSNKDAGASCDDGISCTTNDVCSASQVCAGTAATTYLDADQDGRGDSNFPQNVCPTDGGWVVIGGDCNDSDPDVSQVVANLVVDLDNDGYTIGAGNLQCVGTSQVINGRTYYKDTAGNFTWLLATDSLGTDCLDSDADIFISLASSATDADHDGYYLGGLATNCVGVSSTVNGRTYYANAAGAAAIIATGALGGGECNDADTDVYRTVINLGADVDQDGFLATVPAIGSQCVGATAVVNTRTYYANSAGAFTWLTSPGLGSDCNDNNAAVSGPFPWYVDGDADTFGAGTGTVACASPGPTYVTNNSDCNDASNQVFTNVASLVPDVDQDAYAGGAAATQCVGTSTTVGGRTYYRNTGGTFSWMPSASSLGADCLDSDADVFSSLANSATDADNDGYYTGSLATNCVGSSTAINGRTYYRNASGLFTFIAAGALGGAECNDADADIHQNVANLGADADQDGYLATVPAVATQCVGPTTVVSGRTYYRNASGTYSWLTAPGLGNDCNDGNAAIQGAFNWNFDADGDGYGGATTQFSCASPGPGWVSNGTDCNDGSGNVFQSIASLVVDADQDAYRTAAGATTQCVGATQLAGGRTYYRDLGGSYFWLGSAQSVGIDCNDANAGVLGAPSWYVDTDLDGRGAGTAVVQCTSPGAGYVNDGSDCNNADADVYQNVANLVPDNDNDGYTTGTGATQCVGGTQVINGRTYYRNASAAAVWLNATFSLGTDCNNADGDVFTTQNNILQDYDNDGYPYPNDSAVTQCVGAATTISGRTYYIGTSGTADWLAKNDCLYRSGNTCPYIDCYDLNANARHFQTAYFTTARGDGSFDYDCSGTIAGSPASGTYCASVSTQAIYTDGTCLTGAGSASICTTPTAYALPGACGRRLSAGTGTFTFPGGVCTSSTLASATVVGCR